MTHMNKPSDAFGEAVKSESTRHYMRPRGRGLNVDVVLVLDLTRSMEEWIQLIRQRGIAFVDRIFEVFRRHTLSILARKRVRIVGFRDYGSSRNEAIAQTRFFDLENKDDRKKLDRVLTKLPCAGGRSGKTNALEALHYAINSQWDRDESCRHRYVIMVLTDAPARPLKDARSVANPYYPKDPNMPGTLVELYAEYDKISYMENKLLCLCSPLMMYPWAELCCWSGADCYQDYLFREDGVSELDEERLSRHFLLD